MSDLIIYRTEDGTNKVSLLVRDNEAWLTQNQLAELFATSVQNIAEHIKNILKDTEKKNVQKIKNTIKNIEKKF